MLRILENGKAISLKEQNKRVNAKGSPENVGYSVKFDRPVNKTPMKYAGLRPRKEKASGTSNAKK